MNFKPVIADDQLDYYYHYAMYLAMRVFAVCGGDTVVIPVRTER